VWQWVANGKLQDFHYFSSKVDETLIVVTSEGKDQVTIVKE